MMDEPLIFMTNKDSGTYFQRGCLSTLQYCYMKVIYGFLARNYSSSALQKYVNFLNRKKVILP